MLFFFFSVRSLSVIESITHGRMTAIYNSTIDVDEDTGITSPNFLQRFARQYWSIHGYLSLVVCTFGILTNIVNIIILTEKSMRTSINCILTGIAISDILTMMSYMPFAIHFYIEHSLVVTPEKYTYGWVTFLVFHINITTTTHTISIWLAVFLAILRYTFILSKGRGERIPNTQNTTFIVCLIYALSSIFNIPHYLTNRVVVRPQDEFNETIYGLGDVGIGNKDSQPTTLALINFWSYAIIGKLLPCVLITIFGGLLLHTLQETKERTKILRSSSVEQRVRQHSRTTRMLLAIIVLFLITELPQGILIVISGIVDGFFLNVYILLGDVMDIIALVNNAINFLFYCTMSQHFRNSFVDLLRSSLKTCFRYSFRSDEIGKSTSASMV